MLEKGVKKVKFENEEFRIDCRIIVYSPRLTLVRCQNLAEYYVFLELLPLLRILVEQRKSLYDQSTKWHLTMSTDQLVLEALLRLLSFRLSLGFELWVF